MLSRRNSYNRPKTQIQSYYERNNRPYMEKKLKYSRKESKMMSDSKSKPMTEFIKRHGMTVVLVTMSIGLVMAITSVTVKNYYSVGGHKFGIFQGDGNHKKCLGALLDNNGQPKSSVEKSMVKTCKSNMATSLISICFALIPVIIGISYGITLGVNKGKRAFVNNMFNGDMTKWAMIISIVGASIFQIISLVLQVATPVNGDLNVGNIVESGGKFGPGFGTSVAATGLFFIAAFFLIVMVFM